MDQTLRMGKYLEETKPNKIWRYRMRGFPSNGAVKMQTFSTSYIRQINFSESTNIRKNKRGQNVGYQNERVPLKQGSQNSTF